MMAKEIKETAKDAAMDNINKIYTVYRCLNGVIEVESDSGFESIIIAGDY
jgi:hypothetical protein